jgi:hypothetical protein
MSTTEGNSVTKTTPKCFFDTLSETIEAAEQQLDLRDIVLDFGSACRNVLGGVHMRYEIADKGHMAYGSHNNFDFAIATRGGRPTKKYFHVNIWRSTEGRYELNTYVL